MGRQTLVVRVDEALSRQVRAFLVNAQHGYGSLDEFIEVALTNQLNVEGESLLSLRELQLRRTSEGQTELVSTSQSEAAVDGGARAAGSALLNRPAPTAGLPLAPDPSPSDQTLFVFTNRLSPIKVAARVLASLSLEGSWPELERFRKAAAEAARELGLHLRATDRLQGEAAGRRWIAYPVGADVEKAKSRFVTSFTINAATGAPASGPMALLALANIIEDRVALTRAGWRLAAAPSPLIDNSPGHTLSGPESEIFRAQIRMAPAEHAAVEEFLGLISRAQGAQPRLDELLQDARPEWSRDLVIAQRSAMLGRLADLGAVKVSGRGADALVQILQGANAQRAQTNERTV